MSKKFDELRGHIEAVRKIQTILNYPESLSHEVRRGWPELLLLLRGVHRYFATIEVQTDEYNGLEKMSRMFAELIAPWLHSPEPPSRSESSRFTSLASELTLHFEQYIEGSKLHLVPAEELPKKRAS